MKNAKQEKNADRNEYLTSDRSDFISQKRIKYAS